jgi:hypothetical protein
VDTQKSSVHRDQDQDHHPHACYEGLVFLTYTTFDEEVGDEVEHIESVPCRRCVISSEEDRLDHDEDMLLA